MHKNYQSIYMRLNRKLNRLTLAETLFYSSNMKNTDCILLYTPVHGNLGDHAIVQTQKQLLSAAGRSFVEIPRNDIIMRERAFSKIIPKDKVLIIPGGGFLGSLWPREEYGFRNILKTFPDNRIIVFPQTISFGCSDEGSSFLEESIRVYSRHKHLTIFLRDTFSYEFMREKMPDVEVHLVPDIVTSLKPDISQTTRKGILFFIRDDKEKVVSRDEFDEILAVVKEKFPDEVTGYGDTVVKRAVYPDEREKMIRQKLEEFASAKLVVTDRLHGMLFSTITGTPCIAFNNSNGKVAAQYNWIKSNSYIRMAASAEEFKSTLDSLDIEKTYLYDDSFVNEKMKPLYDSIKFLAD